ncbi:hypothetical protein K402DRAFT_645 [Aulographum hederae CBS 113979]|uniref:Uncharacterized protein n=1 Tax=Aulographum hederae CBS 113979 TaxID=1176131 RepID=A0A6G1HG87_9PEZI|nr:hypothetical protein K402DRAFT_645 [Aulographum hederae CBS 113979]
MSGLLKELSKGTFTTIPPLITLFTIWKTSPYTTMEFANLTPLTILLLTTFLIFPNKPTQNKTQLPQNAIPTPHRPLGPPRRHHSRPIRQRHSQRPHRPQRRILPPPPLRLPGLHGLLRAMPHGRQLAGPLPQPGPGSSQHCVLCEDQQGRHLLAVHQLGLLG